MSFNQEEILRYTRHFSLIGLDGQTKLKAAKVLCVGAGGLGSPLLLYLAAAGIGTLGIIDGDTVELSNLQRQVIFDESQIGINKAKAAGERLKALNSSIHYSCYEMHLSEENANTIISNFNIVVDATDNTNARYLINRVCRHYAIPLVSASIFQFDAQITVFNYRAGPCYECLYPTEPPETFIPNCALAGVLGALPGVMGALQATEVLKIILDKGEILSGKLMTMNLLSMRVKHFHIDKSASCSKDTCSDHITLSLQKKNLIDNNENEVYVTELTPIEFNSLPNKANIELIDVREDYERQICHIGGVHIPLQTLTERYTMLDKDTSYLIYCKGGARSREASRFLLKKGFSSIFNLSGGILAWAEEIDSTMSRY